MRPLQKSQYIAVGLFTLGIIAAIISNNNPQLHRAMLDIERSGYLGAMATGILYGLSLTSATATVIFANMSNSFNPFLIALCGAFGCMLYDVSVFTLSRRTMDHGPVSNLLQRLHMRQGWSRRSLLVVAAIILGSPLPDELAAGIFSLTAIRPAQFLALSFVMNALCILLITELWG